ncbi:hypothetical protein SBF1_460020 [Candidatus Desulfosporosinus infrequens]|uniref:Uncharacterized protein n=1 Tax=Candidatus Desulfosporosinus infrequens TaxID=2043169 RepID=A0A2U3LCT3_9FIRM|nr:hypothetical protein SBF1_460020 [Candidatus Desulfosporosinus infrequens]
MHRLRASVCNRGRFSVVQVGTVLICISAAIRIVLNTGVENDELKKAANFRGTSVLSY